jgi:hypothetical protein
MNACCYRDQCHGDRQEIERLRKRLSGALQHLEEAREGRAAAIDRLTPLGCENTRMRTALEKIAKHRLRGRKTQGALLAEEALKGDI